MDARGRRRKCTHILRVALVLVATFAGTALLSFGGLAAWQGYTENAGNSVGAGTLGHTNKVGTQSCTSVTSTTLLNQSGNTCAAIISVSGVSPSSPSTLATGAVTITSTGALNSTFTMQMPAAATGTLCADLLLAVVDQSSVADYAATALTSQMGATSTQGQRRRHHLAGHVAGPGRRATRTPSRSPRAPASTPTPPTRGRAAASPSSSTQQAA